jgi:aminopeptidase N
MARFLLLSAALLVFSVPLVAQRSDALLDFYRLERQTWGEYLEASKGFPVASPIDVRFYHLEVEPTLTTPYLRGNVLCRFAATEGNTTQFTLKLRREFTVDSVRGNAASSSFAADTILITLDRAFQPGDTGSVRVYYRGVPPLANNTKGLRYTTHAGSQRVIASLSTPFLAHYWWPCKDGPGDKPDSVAVDITLPDTSVAGIPVIGISNGLLVDTVRAGGKRTFRWRHRYPIVPYYVMIAVSNYREFRQTFTGRQGEQFPMVYYVFDEHLPAAQAGVANMPAVMGAFSDRFGVYPFRAEKYGMTQLGYYGAIENQTNTIINNMGASYFDVSVHELAHMWYGDLITCRDWHHGWLNEGFATYAEALWAEHTGGRAAYLSYIQNFQFYSGGTLYLQNITDPFGIFISIIYDKGAMVLHMLRGVMGDSLFFRALSQYSSTPAFMYNHATTEDFRAVCESVSGRNLAFFFDQWVYDQYFPAYGWNWSQNVLTNEVTVNVRQTQGSQGRRGVFEMPVRLKVLFQSGGDTTVTVWNSQQFQVFTLSPGRPVSNVQFDPEMWILRTTTVGVEEGETGEIPDAFALEQNYPNPFNAGTVIRYSLEREAVARLTVYDMLGRRVAMPVNERKPAGQHQVRFDAGELASGVYFYELRAGGETGGGAGFLQRRKLVILR